MSTPKSHHFNNQYFVSCSVSLTYTFSDIVLEYNLSYKNNQKLLDFQMNTYICLYRRNP